MNKLHTDMLVLLRAAAGYGLALDNLLQDLRQTRHRALTQPETERAVRELADRSYVTSFNSPLSGKRWRITALGESALQEEGL